MKTSGTAMEIVLTHSNLNYKFFTVSYLQFLRNHGKYIFFLLSSQLGSIFGQAFTQVKASYQRHSPRSSVNVTVPKHSEAFCNNALAISPKGHSFTVSLEFLLIKNSIFFAPFLHFPSQSLQSLPLLPGACTLHLLIGTQLVSLQLYIFSSFNLSS